MSKLLLILAMLVGVTSANASEVSYENQVAADLIIQQVVAKRLLGSDEQSRNQTEMLAAYIIRNIKPPFTSIEVTSLSCEFILGGRESCQINIIDATDDGTESLNDLRVIIKNGKVKSASMDLITD